MKGFLSILFLALCLSCSTKKLTHTAHQTKGDTTTATVAVEQAGFAESARSFERRDTIVKVEMRYVIDTIDLNPVYNAEGQQIPQAKTVRGKGVSVKATSLPSGQIVLEGSCDSLEQLIPGLIQSRDYYQAEWLKGVLASETHKSFTEDRSEVQKKSVRLHWLTWVGIVGAAAYLIFLLLLKLRLL